MTALKRRLLLSLAVVAGLGLVVGLVANANSSDDGRAAGPAPTAAPSGAPARGAVGPSRHRGPQGRVGQFVVHCTYSHSGPHDPIVHFGHEGQSHRHDFYGSDIIDSQTSAADLLEGGTTCDKAPDKAGYWHPTLYDHGEIVEPRSISAYYRAAPGVDPTTVQTMPTGLALIAGDQTATAPQAGEASGWTCGSRTRISDDPPDCARRAPLHLVLTYQDCWDGENLDSPDHQSHVAFSDQGRCPAGHLVHIPQITVSVAFPIWGPGHDLSLASGSIYSAHGDFLNAWEPEGLDREIRQCIHRNSVCDLASNREEEPLFAG